MSFLDEINGLETQVKKLEKAKKEYKDKYMNEIRKGHKRSGFFSGNCGHEESDCKNCILKGEKCSDCAIKTRCDYDKCYFSKKVKFASKQDSHGYHGYHY